MPFVNPSIQPWSEKKKWFWRVVMILMTILNAWEGFLSFRAYGQDFPVVEVSAGYSYLHIDTRGGSPALVRQECALALAGCPLTFQTHSSFNGWNLAPQFNFTRWLGIKAQFSGQYGSVVKAQFGSTHVPISKQHAYDVFCGGVVSHRARRYTLFAHGLFGLESFTLASHANDITHVLFPSLPEDNVAFVLGGGWDLKISKYFAVRAGQFDYQYVGWTDGKHQNDFRYSGGIVVRIGGNN